MKALIITPFFYPHIGGSQLYMEELWAHIKAQKPEIQVDVLCYNTTNSKQHELYRGMNVYRIPCWEVLPGQFAIPNYISLIRLLWKLTRKNTYNIVNANTRFFESSWWTPLLARMIGAESIMSDHCAAFPVHHSKIVSSIARIIDTYFVPLILKQYSIVTATNGATKRFLESLGVQKVQIVYGGVDTDFFKPARETKHQSTKLPSQTQDNITVTFVGRMIPSKGPQLLLEIAQELASKYPHLSFIFAGGGELYETLSQSATKYIRFLGPLNKAQVRDLLLKTDILIHPSLHHEGFPNVLLEAGASGCTVIATKQGGTNEIINEKTGILVEANKLAIKKALIKLIDNKELRDKYRISVRNFVNERYSWKQIAKQYIITYLYN